MIIRKIKRGNNGVGVQEALQEIWESWKKALHHQFALESSSLTMFHHPKRFEPAVPKFWSKRTKSETLLAAWRSFILSREQVVVKPWQGRHTDTGSPRITGAKHRSYCQLTKCFTDMPEIKNSVLPTTLTTHPKTCHMAESTTMDFAIPWVWVWIDNEANIQITSSLNFLWCITSDSFVWDNPSWTSLVDILDSLFWPCPFSTGIIVLMIILFPVRQWFCTPLSYRITKKPVLCMTAETRHLEPIYAEAQSGSVAVNKSG